MSIRSIELLSIPVSDPQRSLEFYVDKLGFELHRDDRSVPGMRWITVGPRGAGTKISLVTWFDTMPAGSLRGLVLGSENVVADFRRLTEVGVEFLQAPVEQAWGIEAVCRDPDGNELVLQRLTG